jgi:hypothetical protein
MFSFEDCCFAVQKSKETTGRVVMWREFNLINSFTLESSFMGPNRGVNAGLHFNATHLAYMGKIFCKSLVDYVQDQERVNRVYMDLKQKYPQGGTNGAIGVSGGPAPVNNGMSVKPATGGGSNLFSNNNNSGNGSGAAA